MVFVFLYLTLLSMIIFRSIHVAANGIISFFFSQVIVPCLYIPHLLYPFLCWWTVSLFPCPDSAAVTVMGHIFSDYSFVQIMPSSGFAGWYGSSTFSFLYCSPQALHPFTFPVTMWEGILFCTPRDLVLKCSAFSVYKCRLPSLQEFPSSFFRWRPQLNEVYVESSYYTIDESLRLPLLKVQLHSSLLRIRYFVL